VFYDESVPFDEMARRLREMADAGDTEDPAAMSPRL
jgi:hypothetical protein